MADGLRGARLYVLAGPDLARSFALGERVTLGRSDECDVVLRDRSISRKHALLVREGEVWFVQDLGSTNGVTKDGRRAERFELRDGDEFRLGDLPLRFRLEGAGDVQDIEFDLAPRAAPPPVPAPAAPQPTVSGPAPQDEPGPEVEVDEIEIEGPDDPLRAAAEVPARAATVFRPVPRGERRTGLFSADFEQHPFWLRSLLFLGLLVVGAGLAYGAFLAVQLLRGGT